MTPTKKEKRKKKKEKRKKKKEKPSQKSYQVCINNSISFANRECKIAFKENKSFNGSNILIY